MIMGSRCLGHALAGRAVAGGLGGWLGSGLGVGRERQRRRVDAVALTGRPGAVVEDMAQVPAAGAADDLGAAHEQAVVRAQLNGLGDSGLGEAGPTGTGLELGTGPEQGRPAAGAAVLTGGLVVDVLAREGRLGAGLPQDVVLGRRQLLTPLLL